MTRFAPPVVPFVESSHKGGKQRPSSIVIRLSGTSPESGSALGIAAYWNATYSPEDAAHHYVVDESITYRCVPDGLVSGSAPKKCVSILVCAEPTISMLDWEGASRHAALERTADLVAKLCLAHKIRPTLIGETRFARWLQFKSKSRGGIYVDLPGAWPVSQFHRLVQNGIKDARRKEK